MFRHQVAPKEPGTCQAPSFGRRAVNHVVYRTRRFQIPSTNPQHAAVATGAPMTFPNCTRASSDLLIANLLRRSHSEDISSSEFLPARRPRETTTRLRQSSGLLHRRRRIHSGSDNLVRLSNRTVSWIHALICCHQSRSRRHVPHPWLSGARRATNGLVIS